MFCLCLTNQTPFWIQLTPFPGCFHQKGTHSLFLLNSNPLQVFPNGDQIWSTSCTLLCPSSVSTRWPYMVKVNVPLSHLPVLRKIKEKFQMRKKERKTCMWFNTNGPLNEHLWGINIWKNGQCYPPWEGNSLKGALICPKLAGKGWDRRRTLLWITTQKTVQIGAKLAMLFTNIVVRYGGNKGETRGKQGETWGNNH